MLVVYKISWIYRRLLQGSGETTSHTWVKTWHHQSKFYFYKGKGNSGTQHLCCNELQLEFLVKFAALLLLRGIGAHFNRFTPKSRIRLTKKYWMILCILTTISEWVDESENPSPTQCLDRFGSALDGGDLNTRQFNAAMFGNDHILGLWLVVQVSAPPYVVVLEWLVCCIHSWFLLVSLNYWNI